MSPASFAALILEWWRSGDRTDSRLESLTAHFAEQYRLDVDQRALVLAVARARTEAIR